MNKLNPYYYLFAILIIILVSFFLHSSFFSPVFNSDDAVVALMIKDFKLPQDLYFWQANRFGSLVPLIGQFFYKILHCPVIMAEAIAHYLIMITGFAGFASLLKSKTNRIILAMVWFLPPFRMLDILKVSQGEQYAVIGTAVYIIHKLYVRNVQMNAVKKHLALTTCSLAAIISVWVSDLGIITIAILLSIFTWRYIRNNHSAKLTSLLTKPETYYLLLTGILGTLFILYAKEHAAKQDNFYTFFNSNYIQASFSYFLVSIQELLLFQAKEPFTSLYLLSVLFIIILLIFNQKKILFSEPNSIWALVFSIDLIIVFLVIMVSVWSYMNGVPRRYFVCNYISAWIVLLILFDNLSRFTYKKVLTVLLLATVIIGGSGTLYTYKYVFPLTLRPARTIASEFTYLGKIGIISNYWNSYIYSASDPENIVATPHDRSAIRNQSYIDSIFVQPRLVLIRDSWMDSFPDTLEQFGYTLVKAGDETIIANSNTCEYKKVKTRKIIPYEKMTYRNCRIEFDKTLNRDVLKAEYDCPNCRNNYILSGPYIPIGIGKFTARFHIKVNSNQNGKAIALFDVTNGRSKQFSSRKIYNSDVNNNEYTNIDLNFKTDKRYNTLDFRIYYYGNANIYIDFIELIEN